MNDTKTPALDLIINCSKTLHYGEAMLLLRHWQLTYTTLFGHAIPELQAEIQRREIDERSEEKKRQRLTLAINLGLSLAFLVGAIAVDLLAVGVVLVVGVWYWWFVSRTFDYPAGDRDITF